MYLIYGVGINDRKYPAKINNKNILEYESWRGMIRRCYSELLHSKHPTYKDCTASENFKSYSYFYEWCQNQIGFKNHRWHLDKDLLIKGNKIYSEDTCVFLPPQVNILLTTREASRGVNPIGSAWCNRQKQFHCNISIGGRKIFLGYFDNPIDSFHLYKKVKEKTIKEAAEKWKEYIDPRAYNALINYTISIDD